MDGKHQGRGPVRVSSRPHGTAPVGGWRHLAREVVVPAHDELFVLHLAGAADEQRLTTGLGVLGRVIVVGRPEETLPSARTCPGWGDRRQPVLDLMARARLVVISLDTGPGAVREFVEAARTVRPERLVLAVALRRRGYDGFRAEAEAALRVRAVRVRRETGRVWTPPSLPDHREGGKSRDGIRGLISFAGNWEPTFHAVFPTVFRDPLKRALVPVYDRLTAYEDDLPVSRAVALRQRRGEVIHALGLCLVAFAVIRLGFAVWRLIGYDGDLESCGHRLYVIVPAVVVLLCGWSAARLGRRITLRAAPVPRRARASG
ncbi:hypothetical protein FHS29_000524 [Saccharothrix tamanrassetensis]|uniref:Uncharacterized protein n=1 Tax=Saccharothrix tamanrassetensis TaxID=1051531 RepID=A0A841CC66_9PSEU|nr:hypothetical protein [Saccharothrix tamanrassetensis]MBB5953954.1 hypothetical protein [Saccharothrix tamanrassetensis]